MGISAACFPTASPIRLRFRRTAEACTSIQARVLRSDDMLSLDPVCGADQKTPEATARARDGPPPSPREKRRRSAMDSKHSGASEESSPRGTVSGGGEHNDAALDRALDL